MPGTLLRAVEQGLVEPLAQFGFIAAGDGGTHRGESVECSNGSALIMVSADWLEGELSVTVQRPGQPAVPVEEFIEAKALHLRRIRRGASVDMIASTLRKVAEALTTQAPEVIAPG